MIKLYLDEDVHKKIALALRLKGYSKFLFTHTPSELKNNLFWI